MRDVPAGPVARMNRPDCAAALSCVASDRDASSNKPSTTLAGTKRTGRNTTSFRDQELHAARFYSSDAACDAVTPSSRESVWT